MSAYFQTVATVIPVLFVAGLMNPSLLREYSKDAEKAKKLQKEIRHSCIAVSLAIACVAIGYVYDKTDFDSPASFILMAVVWIIALYCGLVLGTLVFYIQKIVALATETHPHPDRFDRDEKDLERRLADVRRKKREAGVNPSASNADSDS